MSELSLIAIHKKGIEVLFRELGPTDAIRFLHLYDSGYGDYTNERKQYLPKDLDTAINLFEEWKKDSRCKSCTSR